MIHKIFINNKYSWDSIKQKLHDDGYAWRGSERVRTTLEHGPYEFSKDSPKNIFFRPATQEQAILLELDTQDMDITYTHEGPNSITDYLTGKPLNCFDDFGDFTNDYDPDDFDSDDDIGDDISDAEAIEDAEKTES